jgi:two-component system sensor kinase FixL
MKSPGIAAGPSQVCSPGCEAPSPASASAYVAELQDREARLRAVFDSVLDGLVTINDVGVIESMNPAAERMFGWTAAELVGRKINELMPEPYRSEHDRYLENYLRTGVRRIIGIGREVMGRRRDGTTFPMELAVTEVPLGARRLFLGVIPDITDKKRIEGMQRALRAKEAHQQGRIEMAAGILHDLGNALTGIGSRAVDARNALDRSRAPAHLEKLAEFLRTHAAQLEAAFGPVKGPALIQLVSASARDIAASRTGALESMNKLLAFVAHTQEVLTTFRGYSGAGAGSTREHMDLRKLLFDAQTMMSDTVAKRRGMIEVRGDDTLPRIAVERSKVMQVLMNLVKNAIEAYDAGGGPAPLEILLSARREGSLVVVEVRDNGPGFDPALAEQLFVEGYSTKQRSSGQGLGASRRILQALGGALQIQSEGAGKGAVALFSLPMDPAVEAA